jgi:uncharacterized membrane protein
MAPNLAGLLAYVPCCIGLVFSLVAAIVEKQSRFVRFHAFQSLLLHAAAIVIGVVLAILQIVLGMIFGPLGFLVWLLSLVVGFAVLAALIVMMIKAYGGEEFELPALGEMARKWC